MVSVRKRCDIRNYILIGAVYAFFIFNNTCRSIVEMNDISPL